MTTILLRRVAPAAGLALASLLGGCAATDRDADACERLLACCSGMSEPARTRCEAAHRQGSALANAQERCREAIDAMGLQCDVAPKTEPADCDALGKSQTISQPCCPGHGVDACGAALFCAAFDGRTQPTCYPERSRPDGSSCEADSHCVSGACNVSAGRCASLPGTPCDPAVGCASLEGTPYGCDAREPPAVCRKIGSGRTGAFCAANGDCLSGVCQANECGCGAGWHRCGQACLLDASPDSCGGSCTPCPSSYYGRATCDAGVCGIACDAGARRCGASCVDVAEDSYNCGKCGKVCPLNGWCGGGSCQQNQTHDNFGWPPPKILCHKECPAPYTCKGVTVVYDYTVELPADCTLAPPAVLDVGGVQRALTAVRCHCAF